MGLRVRIDDAVSLGVSPDLIRSCFRAAVASAKSEAEFQSAVIGLAKAFKWLVHAQRPARTKDGWRTPIQGDPGFPDLALVHPERGQVIFAELKFGKNTADDNQVRWLDALRDAGFASGVWRPSDAAKIEEVICGD
jgi:hypothetical protein